MTQHSDDEFEAAKRIMGKLANTPHKPHEPLGKKLLTDSGKKKGDGLSAKKRRRPIAKGNS